MLCTASHKFWYVLILLLSSKCFYMLWFIWLMFLCRSVLLNFQISGNFANTISFYISNSIVIKEHALYDFVLWNLSKLVLWPSTWSVLMNVLHMLKKNVHPTVVGYSVYVNVKVGWLCSNQLSVLFFGLFYQLLREEY